MILVTGASGFLGNHLLQVLASASLPVRALYNSRKPIQDYPGVEWMQCDLLDIYAVEQALQGITQVYHCAAIVSFAAKDHDQLLQNNIAATTNLVNALLETGRDIRLVHVSSVAALGRAITGNDNAAALVSEETHWEESKQNSIYARSKFESEMEVWRGIAEGLDAVIINPSIILGAGDWSRGSAHLMEIVNREFPWYTEGVNGWVDVRDVAQVMVLLMNSDITAERFIVNNGNYSYRDVFTSMANALGKKPPYKYASNWMTELVWRMLAVKSIFTGRQPGVTKETARTARQLCYYDNSKLAEALPRFQYTPLDETIKAMATQFKRDKT